MTQDVILVPFRATVPERQRNLDFVLRWYEPLGLPVFLGDADPELPFNRAASRNVAAVMAGLWDTALIADADCVADLKSVRRAFDVARETGHLVLPHDDFWTFTQAGSDRVFVDPSLVRFPFKLSDQKDTRVTGRKMPSGALVVTRESFAAIGGYDPVISGWGYEDAVFLKDAELSVGMTRLPGRMFHMWHPLQTGTIEERSENRRLASEHRNGYTQRT